MLGSNPEDDNGRAIGEPHQRFCCATAFFPLFLVLTVLQELPMMPSRNVARRHQNRVRMHFAFGLAGGR